MLLELTTAGFFFIVGLLLAFTAYNFKQPFFLTAAGIVWLVLGVFTLTGQVIEAQPYAFANYTYSNFSVVTNASGTLTSVNLPVISGVNQTVGLVPLTSSGDFTSLATAGLFGFVMLVLAVLMIWWSLIEIGWVASGKPAFKED